MKKENRAYIENNKKQGYTVNKTSKFFSFTSILKLSIALALFIMAALFINAGNVIVENGALNVSNNLLVNTNTLFADSANNRVGIGTTSPLTVLDVNAGSTGSGDSTAADFILRGSEADLLINSTQTASNYAARLLINTMGTASNDPIVSFQNQDVENWTISMDTDDGKKFEIGQGANNPKFLITPAGNVGIGTTNPGYKFTVQSSGAGSFPIAFIDSSGNLRGGFYTSTSERGAFFLYSAAGVQAVGIDTNGPSYFNGGNIGIGTSSPASTLTVIGNFSATGTKAAVINTSQGAIAFYAMESTEVRLYDEGKSALTNGAATVTLDPLFAEVIDTSDYLVYITPKGSSNGLYAEQQTPTSFIVKENNAGTSSIEFSYMVSGKRKAFKDVRLYKVNNFDFGNQTR